ncbi:MAG: zinc-ribbon domain-containing protein [Planctomycetes bacterium]|nr:zinc-ribbon domain-containing protein [Planctomycetota bacterium]
MAVELRCPKCKSKLRLQEEPDADAEIECPKCEHVFGAEDNVVNAGDDDDKPKKKKKPAADQDDKPKQPEKKEAEKKPAAPPQPKKRKKKKSKARKTSPVVLVGIIVTGVMVIGTVLGAMVWFFTKKSASQEMMTYLPDDCDEIFGLNLGHLQKYPEFYKSCESAFTNAGFRKAGQLFATAKGAEFNDTFDYMIYGVGKVGGKQDGQLVEATVLRTKVEFDPGVVGKIPGAKEGTLNGVKYYAIPEVPELGYPGLRVFAPTNRIVVFCRGDIPDAKFKAMLGGNKENPDATPFVRAGAIGKYAIRGTVWRINLYDRSFPRPVAPVQAMKPNPVAGGPPVPAGEPTNEDAIKKEIADLAGSAKASAFKASVGSREVRGEWTLWYKSSDAASEVRKKWKEKEWVKDDEKDPPRWWKTVADKSGGGKTAPNVLKDNLKFLASGELFTVRTTMDTNMIKQGVSSLVSTFSPPAPTPPAGTQ